MSVRCIGNIHILTKRGTDVHHVTFIKVQKINNKNIVFYIIVCYIKDDINLIFWIKGKIRKGGFLRIFTEAFLLFLAPADEGALTLRGSHRPLPNLT